MRSATLPLLAAALVAAACKKTGDGEYQVKVPKVSVSTDTATVHAPDVNAPSLKLGTTKDTITVPTVSGDSIGKKKVEVTRPTLGTGHDAAKPE